MITQVGIALLAFLGLIGGRVLAKLAPEEIRPGKKYFLALEQVILVLLALALLSALWSDLTWIFPFLAGLLIGCFLHKRYLYFGFTLAVATTLSNSLFLLVAFLIFLYGLPYGTLHKFTYHDFFLFAAPFFLLLIPSLLTSYAHSWLALAAGTHFTFWKQWSTKH